MPVSFSIEEPVSQYPQVGIPEGFEPNQPSKYESTVKFSVEEPVAPPKGGVGETVTNVAKATGRGFSTMLQGVGRAIQWAAETGTGSDGATSFRKSAGEIASKLIPIPVAGRKAGEYVGDIADKLRPEWHKNLDIWARNAAKKVGQKVVDYYQKGIEGDILVPTPEFRKAQNMGWTTLPFEKALVATAESAPSFASAVAAGMLLKNPHVPLALLGGFQATQTYGELRDKNIDQEVASTAALMSGAWEAATEKLPFDELLKGPAKNFLKRFLKVGSLESAQELFAQMGNNYIQHFAETYKPQDKKTAIPALKIEWGNLMNGWFESMSAGFLMGGGAAAAVKPPAAGPTVEAAAQVAPAPAAVPLLGDLNDAGKPPVPLVGEPTSEVVAEPTTQVAPQDPPQVTTEPGETYESVESFTDPETSPLVTGQYAILTAENPNAQAATPEANKAANAAMFEQLRQDGYEPIPVEGHYGGLPENRFIVPNMSDAEALAYGKQYGQQSVLTPKGLVYQDGSINPSDKTKIDFSGKQEDFYTKINIAGKPVKFSIPIDFDTKIPAITENVPPAEEAKRPGSKPPKPAKPANPATDQQKIRINAIAKNLGYGTEKRRDIQEQLTGKRSLRMMTKDEAQVVDEYLTREAQAKGLITATADELTARLNEVHGAPTEKPEVKGRREQGLRKLITQINEAVHNFIDRQWHIDRFIEQLDGMTKGALYNTIWKKVRDASNNAADAKHERIQKFKNAGESIFGGPDGFTQFLTGKEQDLGEGIKLSPAERVGVYVYSKNKDSLAHLLGGNFANFPDPQVALIRVLETVTPQERAMGEWILQDMAENFDRVNQASILALGRELTEQDNYFSMYLSEVELEQQQDFLSALLDLQRQPGVVSEPGETVARKKGAKQPIRLDAMANYLHHVDRLEQFIHMGPVAQQVGGILNNRNFKRTLNKITHNTGSDILTKWLRDSSLGYTSESTRWLGKTILFFRQAGVQFSMGWKLPSILRQFLSAPTAAAVHPSVGARVAQHFMNFARPGYFRRLRNTAFSKSVLMRHRSMERLSDYINTRLSPAQRLQYKRAFSNEAMAWMRWADTRTAVIAWNALYDSALNSPAVIKKFGLDGSEKAAVEFADDWIGRTQSMGNVTYLSDFFRGGTLEKLLTTFQNEDSTKWNFWSHDILEAYKQGKINKTDVAYRLMLTYIIPALIFGIIGRGRLQKNWKEVAFDEATYVLGPMFLGGRVVYNAIQGFAGGASGPEELGWVELEKTVQAALDGKPGQTLKHGAKAVGALTGKIPSQAITTATGAYDLATGKTTDLRQLIWTDWSLTKYGTQFNDNEDTQAPVSRRAR